MDPSANAPAHDAIAPAGQMAGPAPAYPGEKDGSMGIAAPASQNVASAENFAAPVPVQAQAPMQPPMAQGTGNFFVNAIGIQSLQKDPAVVDCPLCKHRAMTSVDRVNGGVTHGSAVLLCLCCCLGCIPYM
jgi:lipopolysaccharide-induced tumor necrosis factor-alpha factor